MLNAQTYMRRPYAVQAVQVTEQNRNHLSEFIRIRGSGGISYNIGDWLVNADGCVTAVFPDAEFHASFESREPSAAEYRNGTVAGFVRVTGGHPPYPGYMPIPEGRRVAAAMLRAFRDTPQASGHVQADASALYHAGGDFGRAGDLLVRWGWGTFRAWCGGVGPRMSRRTLPDHYPQEEPVAPATETTESISQWAIETFGDGGTDLHAAVRLMEEVAELVAVVVEFESWDADPETMAASAEHRAAIDRIHPKMREEAADVAIVLARLTRRLTGGDLDLKRPGGGSGWHPFAHQAATLNTAGAKLLAALRKREVDFDRCAQWAPLAAADQDALHHVIDAFEALTRDLGLQAAVDAKMAINRARKWGVVGGHGQHVGGT